MPLFEQNTPIISGLISLSRKIAFSIWFLSYSMLIDFTSERMFLDILITESWLSEFKALFLRLSFRVILYMIFVGAFESKGSRFIYYTCRVEVDAWFCAWSFKTRLWTGFCGYVSITLLYASYSVFVSVFSPFLFIKLTRLQVLSDRGLVSFSSSLISSLFLRIVLQDSVLLSKVLDVLYGETFVHP